MDPSNPSAGFIAFAVEVKNVRGWLYPRDHETWDLMAKVGHFPEVVPILVARRIHPITFRFMRDVGGLAFQAKVQWFSDSIDADRFSAVIQRLGFLDAARVRPGTAHPPLSKWVSTTLRKSVHDGPTLIERQRSGGDSRHRSRLGTATFATRPSARPGAPAGGGSFAMRSARPACTSAAGGHPRTSSIPMLTFPLSRCPVIERVLARGAAAPSRRGGICVHRARRSRSARFQRQITVWSSTR